MPNLHFVSFKQQQILATASHPCAMGNMSDPQAWPKRQVAAYPGHSPAALGRRLGAAGPAWVQAGAGG